MVNEIKLGEKSPYLDQYASELLQPIARNDSRALLALLKKPTGRKLSFDRDVYGIDRWTAYELSWLNRKGKPVVVQAEFEFASHSTAIIESKSFKYYLNSFNQSHFDSPEDVTQLLVRDLSEVSGCQVNVKLVAVDECFSRQAFSGYCVDGLDIAADCYKPNGDLLVTDDTCTVEGVELYSHLLKSNCPVTGQPDWASVWVEYSGQKILPEGFLRYIISLRQHQGFHESCVEQMYSDIWWRCQPSKLSVYARYTRRGGLDINPFRSSDERPCPNFRVARQ